MDDKIFIDKLIHDLKYEKHKNYRNSIYGYVQRLFAFNSNKIEGNHLTADQTALLFEEGFLPANSNYYKAKDIEEMQGHFIMFDTMLDTLNEALSENLIKKFHYELKCGVYEDRAKSYAIGDYKKRYNTIGERDTTPPDQVSTEMKNLLSWYQNAVNKKCVDISVVAEFHAKYEAIHPFQDGNGRTGRLILFRECLKHNVLPFIIHNSNRSDYFEALRKYESNNQIKTLSDLFVKEQNLFKERSERYL